MSVDNARQLIVQAQNTLTQALAELNESPSTPVIKTVAEFDTAYQNANSGDTLVLDQSFKYDKFLVVDKSITIQAVNQLSGRVTKDEPLPSFVNGIQINGNNINFKSVEGRYTNPSYEIVNLLGTNVNLIRMRLLGDPVNGQRRGISANGSQMTVTDSFIDDIGLPGTDTQAVCSWDMAGGLNLLNSYFAGAAESVMFGGGDSVSSDRMAHDITMIGCDLSKNPAWFNKWQTKNALEFKAARRATVKSCDFKYGGTDQGDYLIVATPRNQDGNAPWSCIEDIVIQNCTGSNAGGILNTLGTDNENTSGILSGLVLSDSQFTNIIPTLPNSQGRLFMFGDGPNLVVISNLQVQGSNLAARGYFYGKAPTKLTLTKLTLPDSLYGWHIDNDGAGHDAILQYAPDAILDDTIQ